MPGRPVELQQREAQPVGERLHRRCGARVRRHPPRRDTVEQPGERQRRRPVRIGSQRPRHLARERRARDRQHRAAGSRRRPCVGRARSRRLRDVARVCRPAAPRSPRSRAHASAGSSASTATAIAGSTSAARMCRYRLSFAADAPTPLRSKAAINRKAAAPIRSAVGSASRPRTAPSPARARRALRPPTSTAASTQPTPRTEPSAPNTPVGAGHAPVEDLAGRAPEGVLAVRVPQPPRAVRARERHGVQRRDPPRAPQEHRDPTTITIVTATPEHMSPSAPGADGQPVPAVDRTVVIGQQQLHEPEHERAGERDLERPQHVLRARRRTARTPKRRRSPSRRARRPAA